MKAAGEQAQGGMAPAHQGLGAHHAAIAQVHLGLIEQLELALGIGLAQRLHQREPRGHVRAHLRLEEADGPPAVVFGPGQRQAGRRQHIGRILAPSRHHAGADTGQHMVPAAVHFIGGGQHRQDGGTHMAHQRRVRDGCQEHAELVAAHAPDDGVARGGVGQPPGHALENGVALGMPVHVIEGAEVVDAHQQQSKAWRRLAAQARLQSRQVCLASDHAGQRIEIRRRQGASRLYLRPGHHPCPISCDEHSSRSSYLASVTKTMEKSSGTEMRRNRATARAGGRPSGAGRRCQRRTHTVPYAANACRTRGAIRLPADSAPPRNLPAANSRRPTRTRP